MEVWEDEAEKLFETAESRLSRKRKINSAWFYSFMIVSVAFVVLHMIYQIQPFFWIAMTMALLSFGTLKGYADHRRPISR